MRKQVFGLLKSDFLVDYFISNHLKTIILIILKFELNLSLSSDVLASLCVANKNKLELKIDNVVLLCAQSVLKINKVIYNVVFALKVNIF